MKRFIAIVTILLAVSIPITGCTEQASPEENNHILPVSVSIPTEILNSNFGFLGATFNALELEAFGIHWDRPHPGPFIWGQIEKTRGIYDWDEVDQYVARAQQRNFATLATIWPFAGWD